MEAVKVGAYHRPPPTHNRRDEFVGERRLTRCVHAVYGDSHRMWLAHADDEVCELFEDLWSGQRVILGHS